MILLDRRQSHGLPPSSDDFLNITPLWIRARLALVRNIHAAITLALATCVALPAAAEEPSVAKPAANPAVSSNESAPAVETTPAPSDDDLSEADSSESQGVSDINFDAPPVDVAVSTPSVEPKDAPPPSKSKTPRVLGVRVPAFIALSLGSLSAGGAVVTRIASNWPSADPKGCNGRCPEGSHTVQTTSTILAGIAVAAVGTGVVLALSDPGKARKRFAMAPVLGVSVSSNKAGASAAWRF
jgi:hypothetical protein